MAALLKILDERFGPGGADRQPAVELRLVSERVTPREIIRRRVEVEVEALNRKKLAHAAGHARARSFLVEVEADSPEAVLNGPGRPRRAPRLDRVDEATARALAAFERRRFIMLFDDRQLDDLDAEITVTPQSQAVFLYLTPLKGG